MTRSSCNQRYSTKILGLKILHSNNSFFILLELDLGKGQQNEVNYDYGGNGNGQSNGDNYNYGDSPPYYGGDAGTELEYNCYR